MIQDKINASPRKKLFIDILTQDIKVETCIFDLIDNSFDSYVRNKIEERREIKLTINNDNFEIYDTCGGIEKETLKKNVFRFGAESLDKEEPTLGMYGIGLKRSIFKMGDKITMETDDGKDYSLMDMTVTEWQQQGEHDWDIPFETDKSNLANGALPYTRIKVSELHKEIVNKFTLDTFKNDILESLKRSYCLIIKNHIDFTYNKNNVVPYPLIVPYDDNYTPSVHIETYNELDINIICFIDPRKGERLKDAVNKRGWNLFCNNRLILANDIYDTTGWIGGEKHDKSILPKYHSIYNEFRGIVFLKSNNPFNLPLNTAKDNLNTEDKNYNYVLKKMIKTARPVVNYLTKKYAKEQKQEEAIEETIEETIDENYNPEEINATEIEKTSEFKAPTRTVIKEKEMTTITYLKEKKLVDIVRSHLGVKSNKEAGKRTFDFYVKMEDLGNGQG